MCACCSLEFLFGVNTIESFISRSQTATVSNKSGYLAGNGMPMYNNIKKKSFEHYNKI